MYVRSINYRRPQESISCVSTAAVYTIRGRCEMFVKALIVVCGALALADAKHIKGIQIKNRGTEKLWVEMTDEEGFYLPPGQLASIIVEDNWVGKINSRPEECGKKECKLPVTEAVLQFNGEENEDHYYVSMIEGFNRQIKIQPTTLERYCKPSVCQANINHLCPPTHQSINLRGEVVACKAFPELFQKLCPHAVTTVADVATKWLRCRSNTYLITIG